MHVGLVREISNYLESCTPTIAAFFMSTFIETIIKSDNFLEDHLSQCHGAILPRSDIIHAFAKRIKADMPSKRISDRYVEILMYNAGIRSEALLNWFYFFCEEMNSEDFGGFWFHSLGLVEKPVENMGINCG